MSYMIYCVNLFLLCIKLYCYKVAIESNKLFYFIINLSFVIIESVHLLSVSYYILPTTYHLLHTTYYIPPTTYHLLHTTYYVPPTAYHLLHTTYYVPFSQQEIIAVTRAAGLIGPDYKYTVNFVLTTAIWINFRYNSRPEIKTVRIPIRSWSIGK